MRPSSRMQGSLPALLALLALLAVVCVGALPSPHGSGWVPSGAWSSPSFGTVGTVGAVSPWPSQGWTDYSVSVDPWATQVVKKKPSYASLYPWPEKPAYRSVPLHVPAASPSYTHAPQPQSGGYAGWTRIPVLDEEGGNQWVAWVPEELGDFVIVRKDKLKPKKKKVEEVEEEEEEPEPPKPKPKKKVKTIVEEEAPEEEPPKPKKKVKTIVEEEAPDEEPKPKKRTKVTVMEDEPSPPKKTTKTTVTTEEQAEPATTVKETSDTRVTKTEVIEQASTVPESVSVPAPTK